MPAVAVEVRELLSGELVVLYHDALLATQPWPGPFTLKPRSAPTVDRPRRRVAADAELRHALTELAQVPVARDGIAPSSDSAARRVPGVPAPTHPWRRAYSRRRLAFEAAQRGMTFSPNS